MFDKYRRYTFMYPPLLANAQAKMTNVPSQLFNIFLKIFFWGNFFSYFIQHCFICRPSDSTVPTDAGIEPRTVATSALTVRRSIRLARFNIMPYGKA
jgi:hypothetical protein